jgi:putative transposase
LDEEIREIYDGSKGRYGSPKITQELRDRGHSVSKNRVAKRMREAGLRSKIRRRYRVTTDSKHRFPIATNLVERNFTTQTPNRVWVSDITYLSTRTGWLYLTVIIDLFSRLVVGWSLSSSLSHDMVVTALKRAVTHRRPVKVLFFIRIEVSNMLARTFEKN